MPDDSRESVDSLLVAVAGIAPRPIERPGAWRPPAELDEYRVIQPLGRGGMGSVWLGHDRLLERLVAIKFIADAEPDRHLRERFALEARAAARLQHENVVSVYRYGEIAGRAYLVSEYVRGQSLDKLDKPMPWRRSLDLGVALARGLAAAHRHGIVHRDIKPANAILSDTGDVKLVDFGLAKLGVVDATSVPAATIAPVDPTASTVSGDLTAPGSIAGTPRYLAPEVRLGEPASRQSDVYQIGCILYELVVGHAPIFDASGDAEVPSIGPRVGDDGARFAVVVDRCLRREPGARYASGDELREALEQIATPIAGGTLPEGNPYRGLVAFESEHRALFFGRGPEIRAVIERLRADALVVVTGDSGVGKSSLCRAGVLPHLTDGAFADGLTWSTIQLVPGKHPLTALASTLASHLELDEAQLVQQMRDEPMVASRELRRAQGASRGLVVFVDQLEELATFSERAEAEAFGAALGAAASRSVRVLATVRSDFLTRVADVPGIGTELSRALYLLKPLTADGARDAVVGPARAKGVRFESDELVDTLVGAVTDASHIGGARPVIELPLLAFTLAQLWEARDTTTQSISARSLEAIGGVRGALARHADGVIDALLPAPRRSARQLLSRLVTPERTRIRRSADELAGIDRAALDALVRGRLVVARGGDAPTYELAHERLIDGWPALADWLSQAAEARAVHTRLASAVADWDRLSRGDEALWSERQLAELDVIPPDDLTPAETEFVTASRRRLRRRRYTRRGLAIAVPLVIAAFYVGARIVAARDLDRHVAENIDEADRELVRARTASAIGDATADAAYRAFDAGAHVAESLWASARDRNAQARDAYTRATRALEAAFFLDTDRADVRRRLAEITLERIELADHAQRVDDRRELESRLALYDPDRVHSARLGAPARIAVDVTPASATIAIVDATGAERILPERSTTLAAGAYTLIARAPGYAPAHLPILLRSDTQRRASITLPVAAAVPDDFVYLPAGSFLYGSRDDEGIRQNFFGTVPMHEVSTADYAIGRHEVTFGEWIAFLDDLPADERARRTPSAEPGTDFTPAALSLRRIDGTWELKLKPATITYTARVGTPIVYADRTMRRSVDWSKLPVSAISPEDAEAFARWLARTGRVPHARLCNEREWERAARGADGRSYPHGDRLEPDDVNIDTTYGQRDGGFGPDPVGAHPRSTSPVGLDDTSGNVWDITHAAIGSGYASRGGNFYTNAITAHLANRQDIMPNYRHALMGLRICADVTSRSD